MKNKETKYALEVDTQVVEEGLLDTKVIILGLQNACKDLEKALVRAFCNGQLEFENFNKTVKCSKRTFQKDVQEMKTALEQVAEPVGKLFIPVMDLAVRKITDVAQSVGIVLSTLMGMDTATKKVEKAAEAEESLKKASVSAASAVKRSLAGFDQINRLDGPSGRSYSTAGENTAKLIPQEVTDTISPQVQAMVSKIMALLEPVRKIDLTPLKISLEKLGNALSGLGEVVSQSLQWVWFQVLVPLGKWIIEEAGPVSVGVLTQAFQALRNALEPVLLGIQSVRIYLEPMVQFVRETALLILEQLQQQFQRLAQVFSTKGQEIQTAFQAVGQALGVMWEKIQPVLTQLRTNWLGVMDAISSGVSNMSSMVVSLLTGLISLISGTLSGNWSAAWNGLKTIFQGVVNGIIGMFNGLIRGVVSGINSVIRAINQVKLTLPDWDVLGNLAGKSYGMNLKTVSAPQIPYLAKGAVLPANRPFLAMVGDQRHGTNVEAPLATIQEAVALVMDDMIASNAAGQEMIVGVLQELLEAVMGIRVGDEVIGRAVQRYNRKMAVVKGGYV